MPFSITQSRPRVPHRRLLRLSVLLAILSAGSVTQATPPGQYRLLLKPSMVQSSSDLADFRPLVDEQLDIGDPPTGKPRTAWKVNSKHNRKFPFSATIDLGRALPLATLWLFDTHNKGEVAVSAGKPGDWREVAVIETRTYKQWRSVPLNVETRYLKLEVRQPSALFAEIAIDAYSPKGWRAVQARLAEEAKREAERQAALKRAREEALKRPIVEMAPFGRLSLVDEIDCASDATTHMFRQSPAHASRVETVLGKRCRVLAPVKREASYIAYRIGRMKLLRPGAAYVLAVEYPEDAPRSMVVINTGNETSRGFHTGLTVGDALHPKYVNNHCESLDVPLSGKWETWTHLFRLHDRFPELGLVGGAKPRTLTPEDGFDVTLAQFSARNCPMSKGLAVRRMRLFEVVDPDRLAAKVHYPPDPLPRRRIFWREEMSDGVIAAKDPARRGVKQRLDWYRYKADLMRFLAINTYTKDLLEFGACQHWDSSAYGGNKWVYYNADMKDLWGRIVKLMGSYGFDVLPYYEYAGSKGQKGLGNQRRCKPLTRDDAYTHIRWVESANSDITDPDTYDDFKKMLDLTVIRHQDNARFAGIWIRSRSQLPISFSNATRARFAREANDGRAVTRDQLKSDKTLYGRYIAWWQRKRRDFFVAMRDHLRSKGIEKAVVLYTGCANEPGVDFHSWKPRLVTDRPALWSAILQRAEHLTGKQEVIQAVTLADVVRNKWYLEGLTSPGLNWGKWEWHHARPADDPQTYRDLDGVLLTHAFNRLYTVADPATLALFRTRTGLAIVRHYALNEHMMFDPNNQPKLGYFVADIERAGPFCMMAEAVAVANGDPTMIGYLASNNFGRGFPAYVRDFNANFLALPALPSERLDGAASDPAVVVRAIRTQQHGTYLAVVNTARTPRQVTVQIPAAGPATLLASGDPLAVQDGRIKLTLRPFQLVAVGVGTR